jgi:hypothetical protein
MKVGMGNPEKADPTFNLQSSTGLGECECSRSHPCRIDAEFRIPPGVQTSPE